MPLLASFLDGISNWGLAGLGIGLVIFVHELGHFLVAKKCGVRCEIFSLGFGPRIFGFKRGGTDYRLSLVPIGGYVKMAGDNPGENLEGDEGELPSKSVMQRLCIFSAGVVMNLIFALVTLPLVLAVGVLFHSTVLGGVDPGSPAWRAGLTEGDEIVSIADHEVYDFGDIVAQVALSDPGPLPVQFRRDGELLTRNVVPEKDEQLGRYAVGIHPSFEDGFRVVEDGPAQIAGMKTGDKIVSFNGEAVGSLGDFQQKRVNNLAATVTLEVATADSDYQQLRTITLQPEADEQAVRRVGITQLRNEVASLRGMATNLDLDLRPGDELIRLRVFDPNSSEDGTFIPVRYEDELADAFSIAAETSMKSVLEVSRRGKTIQVELPNTVDETVAGDIALIANPKTWVRIKEGYPAETSGLPYECKVVKVNGKETNDWIEISDVVQESSGAIRLSYLESGKEKTVEITPREEVHYANFGLALELSMVERKYGFAEACQVGAAKSMYMLKNIYLTLKKIFAQDVSPKNLSGIVTIARVSKSLAESGVPSLFFFLSILSLNLAFLNVLPIPVLDGGHIMFLLVEKIKGSPVSERVMGYSQLVGLVMVLALLLYVTYNDLVRLFQT